MRIKGTRGKVAEGLIRMKNRVTMEGMILKASIPV